MTEVVKGMPDRSAIERGNKFERLVQEILHLRPKPGSGNKWFARGDGAGGGILVECKATKGRSWAETRRQLSEAKEEALGTGDVPVLAVLDDDNVGVVVIELSDFARIRTELVPVKVEETATQRRRRLAGVPVLLRGGDAA
jgi:hypothetical protein